MKKTKIICTIGPACNTKETIIEMINAGMNVARINFSHGTSEEHKKTIQQLKKIREGVNAPLGIMLDTKGPEIRIKTFKNGKEILNKGDEFVFTTKEVEGTNKIVSVSYKNLHKEISVGDTILVCNGLLIFKVKNIKGQNVECDVVAGGEISNNKSMNFPKKVFKGKYISEQDKNDILLGISAGVDFVACSFVSNANDVLDVRKLLDANGGQNIEIIAKIENYAGVDNVDEILKIADGLMVARGDMGVEIEQEKLPYIQKHLIKKCLNAGKVVITATEMLESMINNPRPTRAETSDVANAVYDGSSAVMLSGETAAGKYPVMAVSTMAKIVEETEKNIKYHNRFENISVLEENNLDAVCRACCRLSIDTNAKAIVACSKTGRTIKQVSRFHSSCNILGLTTDKNVFNRLSLYFGVDPLYVKDYKSLDSLFKNATILAKQKFNLKQGDNIIITGGTASMTNTNLLKLEKVD